MGQFKIILAQPWRHLFGLWIILASELSSFVQHVGTTFGIHFNWFVKVWVAGWRCWLPCWLHVVILLLPFCITFSSIAVSFVSDWFSLLFAYPKPPVPWAKRSRGERASPYNQQTRTPLNLQSDLRYNLQSELQLYCAIRFTTIICNLTYNQN